MFPKLLSNLILFLYSEETGLHNYITPTLYLKLHYSNLGFIKLHTKTNNLTPISYLKYMSVSMSSPHNRRTIKNPH